ncbi:MAG: hypothetical protein WC561_01560 [Candidatus Omnitrophota bacterium]|jgi:hypothetical protein
MKNNKIGLTILEILISSVILAITVAGLSGIFVSGKKYILHERMRMSGGGLGAAFIDPSQVAVMQGQTTVGSLDGWNQSNNALRVTPVGDFRYCDSDPAHASKQASFCPPTSARTMSNTEYSAKYKIEDVGSINPVRKVATTITWTETD